MATSSNNKRIARNTIMLYIRMVLLMLVTLYTSRVVLAALGVEDFGVYNVVGGVVTLLAFLNSSLGGAGSRFITYALGENDEANLRRTFSTVVTIHTILAGLILVFGETIGLWLVLNKLVIPESRMTAAMWVYQCSILTAMVSILSVPYNSLIIAHEKMDAYAYISIVDALLRLVIVWLLVLMSYDHLICYAILCLGVQIVVRCLYGIYCYRKFPESRVGLCWSAPHIKKISNFAGWTMTGNLAVIGYNQGLSIVLNIFFGPVVNAARSVADQVNIAVSSLVNNFQQAVRPQIIKNYANKNLDYMHTLVVASSKYGFYLVWILALPVLLFTPSILGIWLVEIPPHTVEFVRIIVVVTLIAPFRAALTASIHATGDMKKFSICESALLLSIVPVAYLALKFYHISAEAVFIVYLVIEVITQGVRTHIVLKKITMPVGSYISRVVVPAILVAGASLTFLLFVDVSERMSLWKLLLEVTLVVTFLFIVILAVGINKHERTILVVAIRKFLHKSVPSETQSSGG